MNKTSTAHLSLLATLSLTTFFGACADLAPDEPIDEVQSSIRNGTVVTPWPNATPAYTRSIVRTSRVCTGTLVAPEWVLTAKHCGHAVGDTVTNIRPNNASETRTVDRVEGHPVAREDGALLHLEKPINDVPAVPLYWGTMAGMTNQTITCYGYGDNEVGASCSATVACPADWNCFYGKCIRGRASQTLRKADLLTSAYPDQVAEPGTVYVKPITNQQVNLPGDSGGPCFFQGQLAASTGAVFTDLSAGLMTTVPDYRAWMLATMRSQRTRIVQGLPNDTFYFLDASNQLWLEFGSNYFRSMIDSNVRQFHAVDASTVYVLDFTGRLWREFTNGTPRQLVDGPGVREFQAIDATNVMMLGSDGNLFREAGTWMTRTHVDSNVLSFRSVGPAGPNQHVFVLDRNRTLWNETGTAASRVQVSTNVVDFHPVDNSRVYVLADDYRLWNVLGTNWNQVDANVVDFQGIDASMIYVLGRDAKLWRERGSYLNRDLVDSNVARYHALDATTEYVLRTDGGLYREVVGSLNRLVEQR